MCCSLTRIHPFADGNGRTGQALALWKLYRRGLDTHHIFSVDEYYWEDRQRYYAALSGVRQAGEDLTAWLEYCAAGLRKTLEHAWLRIQSLQVTSTERLDLRPRQEQLLHLLHDHGSMAPAEIGLAIAVFQQYLYQAGWDVSRGEGEAGYDLSVSGTLLVSGHDIYPATLFQSFRTNAQTGMPSFLFRQQSIAGSCQHLAPLAQALQETHHFRLFFGL